MTKRTILKIKKIIREEINRKQRLTESDVDILNSYLEAALFTDGEQLENEYEDLDLSISNIDKNSINSAKKDIATFIKLAKKQAPTELESYNNDDLGHNIWLSRNGHGAGFFDDNNDTLQSIAEKLKEKLIYAGDDGKIYID